MDLSQKRHTSAILTSLAIILALSLTLSTRRIEAATQLLISLKRAIVRNTLGERCLSFGLFQDWFNNSEGCGVLMQSQ